MNVRIVKTLAQPGTAARYRLGVVSRVLAAIIGGYILTAAVTALLSAWLPMQRADAVITATLLSFTVYACAVLWVFATRNALRAWLGMILPALLAGAVLLARQHEGWGIF